MNGLYEATASRSIDVELEGDVIAVDLDNLDPDASDILDLLKEAESPVWIWARIAGEYWRKGHLVTAEGICKTAIEAFTASGKAHTLWPIYALKANIQISHSRRAPKHILPTAKRDVIRDEITKETHFKETTTFLNKVESVRDLVGESPAFQMLSSLTRSLYRLAEGGVEDALLGFDSILSKWPTNIPALLGKARIHFTKREYGHSLATFQKVLLLSPNCRPDPRIGIGLCLWYMNNHEKAVQAWERSAEVNPDDWAVSLILGLEAINRSKDPKRSDQERARAYQVGSKRIEKAFKTNNKSAAAANALSEFFLRKGDNANSLKLAERVVQYSDTKPLLCDGHLRMARVFHADAQYALATRHYQAASDGPNRGALPSVGLAQMQLQTEEVAAAIHTLDTYVQNNRASAVPEASIMLASLRANPRRGVSSAEVTQDKKRARDMFDQIWKILETSEHSESRIAGSTHRLADDMDMYLDIARLWQQDSADKVMRALKEALRISQAKNRPDPRIVNNLAALTHIDGGFNAARLMYEDALRMASTSEDSAVAECSTTILYNLARVYEAQDEVDLAKAAYEKLLQRHPEYADARVRQAHILRDINQVNEAHEVLKQALAAQSNNLNLRAHYTHFLLQTNQVRPAKDFVFATLKDHDKHDIYSLCSAGYIMYQQARESRDVTPDGLKKRRRDFERAVELYEKALSLDSMCAIAAQGLAIATAEDALGNFGQGEDQRQRLSDAREAIDIFAKVRETIADGSVYSNMGHCYYTRDEFDRAIESYETASKRFYGQQNVNVLLYLSRTHYAKAAKDQNYSQMGHALKYAQKAMHLSPHDKAIVYNIAMIEQKAAEMLFAMDPSKRTLPDLKVAIEHAEHAQRLFSSLASDKGTPLPYSKDLADQRRKYGEVMLRKTADHLAAQEAYEAEVQEKMKAARQRRQEERDRVNQLEQERLEQQRDQAAKIAEERRKAREDALTWTAAAKAESDEEREKKVKRPRKKADKDKDDGKAEGGSGDEAPAEEPKKKRKGRLKKADQNGDAAVGDEEDGLSAGEEEKPKKRLTKKRVIRDEDDEDPGAPRKKLIKSKETISDSDDDME